MCLGHVLTPPSSLLSACLQVACVYTSRHRARRRQQEMQAHMQAMQSQREEHRVNVLMQMEQMLRAEGAQDSEEPEKEQLHP